jgi:hypothetical protein
MTISFVMSVCPSVHMEQLGFHWTYFDEAWYLSFFRKSVKKIQVSLKSDKNSRYFTCRLFTFMTISRWIIIRIRNNNNGTLHADVFTFMTISHWILLRMRNVLDKSCRENQNTVYFQQLFFQRLHCLWSNVERYGVVRGSQMMSQHSAYELHAEHVRLHTRTRMHKPKRPGTRANSLSFSLSLARTHTHTHIIYFFWNAGIPLCVQISNTLICSLCTTLQMLKYIYTMITGFGPYQ